MTASNPFVFERPLQHASDLVGRDQQLLELVAAVREGHTSFVEGPDGLGKTSLLNAAVAALARDGGLGVRVDCAGVLTADDFAARVSEAYAQARAQGPAEEALIERLEAFWFQVESGNSWEPADRAAALLAVGDQLAVTTGKPVAICFDDVQDALALPAGTAAIGAARAEAKRAGFAMSGTAISGAVKPDVSGAIAIGPIDPEAFAASIARRFEETGRNAGAAAKLIARVGAGHPQRTHLLAWHLWEMTGEGETATAVYARLAINQALERLAPELEVRWQALHSNERRVAVAIANNLPPQGTRAQRATGLAGFGAAQRAVRGVKASGVARLEGERLSLTDPLFAEWLRRRYPQASPEPGAEALRRRASLQRGQITRGM